MKASLLFPGLAFALGIVAFILGYRTPPSLPATPARVAETRAAQVWSEHQRAVMKSGAVDRSGVRVEGFAKIGFAQAEELLASASPEQREQWAQEFYALGDTPLQRIALIGFYSAWLDVNPEEALGSLQKYPDILHRADLVNSLSAACPPALQPKLIAIVSTWSEMEQRMLFPGLLVHLAETDPAATAEFMDSHRTQFSDSDAAALISIWARDDARTAARWLDASSYSGKAPVVRSLIDSWLTKDPVAAQDYVIAHRQNEGMEEAAASVALHLFRASPDQTREFIRSFDDQRASTLLTSLAESATDGQLAALVNWLTTFPAAMEDDALQSAFARYYSVDSPQALNWLRSQPAAKRDNLLTRPF